jgi:hypothetical protein
MIITSTTGNFRNLTFDDMNSVGASAYPREGIGLFIDSKGGNNYIDLNSATFNNCKTAIQGHRCGTLITGVTINNVDYGIDWERSQTHDLDFISNTITARKCGIRSSLNEPVAFNSSIFSNTITVSGVGAGTTPAIGIQANEGGMFSPSVQPGQFGWQIDVNNVTMQNGGRGIHYRNGQYGRVLRNSVTNFSQAFNYDGIWVEGAGVCDISANTINQSLTSAGLGNSSAIRSSGGNENSYTFNCVDNTNAGLLFFDMGDFSERVVGNSINNHVTGLQLGDPGIGNVFIGQQHHTGNIWDLSAIPGGGFGGVHWGGQFVANASAFYVDELENPALNPPVDPVTWFEDQNTAAATTPAIGCSFPPMLPPFTPADPSEPSDLDLLIAGGALPTDMFQNETRWKAAYRLSRKLLRYPGMENKFPLLASFKSANANLSTSALAYIAEQRSRLYELSASELSTVNNLKAVVVQKRNELRQLDSLIQAGQVVSPSQYATAEQDRLNAQAKLELFQASFESNLQVKIANLATLNAAVSPSIKPDINHQAVNAIFLELLAADSLSSTNLALLLDIAGQCPLEGGDAVYEARSIVAQHYGQEFDDRTLCLQAGQREQQKLVSDFSSASDITFYPNPSSGSLYWTNTGAEPVLLRLYNPLGQLLLSQESADGFVSIAQFLPGIYTAQLVSNNGKVLTATQVVLTK